MAITERQDEPGSDAMLPPEAFAVITHWLREDQSRRSYEQRLVEQQAPAAWEPGDDAEAKP